jgi:hypothetical protein
MILPARFHDDTVAEVDGVGSADAHNGGFYSFC